MSETLYAIDVFSLVFQVFHAIPAMTSPSGQPTNAIFGFARDVLNILKSKQPTYLVCAMDSPGPGTREALYPQYKANRSEMPDELRPQMPVIAEMIRAFGIPVLQHEGWEADDILATLARRATERGIASIIVTNDKDARQLIGPLVLLYNVRKDIFLDADALRADWGIRPDQVVDFQALVGDSVDNVPGVPQIGPKTATSLLAQFETLDEVLRRANEVTAKRVRENLKTYGDQARMSRQLVELNTQLDFELDWERARIGQYNAQRLVELFRECGFRRLVDEVRQLAPLVDVAAEPAPVAALELTTIHSLEELERWLAGHVQSNEVAIRLETTGTDPLTSHVVAVTLAGDACRAAFIPLDRTIGEPAFKPADVWAHLTNVLNSGAIRLVGHDLKPIINWLSRSGFPSAEYGLDTMVGSYLLTAGSRSHSLAGLAERYFEAPLLPISQTLAGNVPSDPNDPGKTTLANTVLNPSQLAQAASEEACLTLRIASRLREELQQAGLWTLYEDLERPLIAVLAEMERIGVRVDADELARQNVEATQRIETLLHRIYAEAGEEFNVDSPKQLRTILFDKLHLPVIKKTKTGPSTDQDVLEQLALVHPLPAMIIEHRQLMKLKGTYLDALPLMINPKTGRIHASFNQVVAATGRLSSSNPNLQNIPIRTPEGERVRRAFVAGESGWKLVCADYSQIELRMLAHFSNDPALVQAFRDGVDVHAAVAAEVFSVAPDHVTPNQRRIAKAVNFGVIYGQSAFGLSEALGISRDEAAVFIANYFQRYQGVVEFLNKTLDETLRTGFAKTILGRRRGISGIREERHGQLNMPERTAVNTVIQGSAADLIKRAMIHISERLKREQHPAKMLLQIHDELVFETPESAAASLIELVRHEMEHALPLSVPVQVDISVGDNWLDAK